MDILKEFLDATTIHGLYYISTCKSWFAKAGWMVVVALGFAASTFLIHSSFADWAKSPVATTITPHSVADLPFPNVTICPPKGLNNHNNHNHNNHNHNNHNHNHYNPPFRG